MRFPSSFARRFCRVRACRAGGGQRADDQIMPKSVELQRQARQLISAGKLEEAEDTLETALAVDPRNRGAFVDIARVAEKQHLFGKAIRMTNKAIAARAERSGRDRGPGRSDGRNGRDRARPGQSPEAADDLRR